MFVAGASTHKVGAVAHTLLGVAPSASAISRLNQDNAQQFKAWRERPLQAHWRIVYLDGIHFDVRHGDQVDAIMILTALGWTWRATRRCWRLSPVPRRTKTAGCVCSKTCAHASHPDGSHRDGRP